MMISYIFYLPVYMCSCLS